jgi:hypothetical protein
LYLRSHRINDRINGGMTETYYSIDKIYCFGDRYYLLYCFCKAKLRKEQAVKLRRQMAGL